MAAPISNEQKTGRKLFEPGNPGGPGRPKGSRNQLGEDFLKALHEDFTAHGIKTIAAARKKDPVQYLKTIASILPKELSVKIDPLDEMTHGELIARLRELDLLISPALGREGQNHGALGEERGSKELRAVRPN